MWSRLWVFPTTRCYLTPTSSSRNVMLFQPPPPTSSSSPAFSSSRHSASIIRALICGSACLLPALAFNLSAQTATPTPATKKTQTAATATNTQSQAQALPEVIVSARADTPVASRAQSGTKTTTPLAKTPQAISVVTRDEIDKRQAQTVQEALNYTPGVLTGAAQGIESRVDDITIRGFDVSGFTTSQYLDGLRVANGGQWTRSQYDIFGLERVEVVKGPAAVLYGQVTPGGLLNQVSKRPTEEARGLASIQYGSFGTWQYAGDVSGPIDPEGRFLYRLVGLYRDGGSQVDHTDLNRWMIAPSLTWNISEDTHLTLMFNYQQDRGGATYQFLPVNGTLYPTRQGRIPRGSFIGEPGLNTFNREQFSFGYEFEHRFNDVFTLQQNARYEEVETFYESVVGGRFAPNPVTGMAERRAVRGFGQAMNIAVDTRLRAEFETGAAKHTLLAGIDLYYSEWDHLRTGTNTVPQINVFSPVYTGVPAPFVAQVSQHVSELQIGAYLQEQLEWNRWHLTLSGRYDHSRINLYNTLTRARSISDEGAFSGRAGLLYAFESGLAPYVSYATSFEPVSGTTFAGVPFDATTGQQMEAGLKFEPKGLNALFTLSAFELTQQNALTLDPNNPLNQIQTGEIQIRGVEFESKIALKEGLTLYGGVTFMNSKITRSNEGFTNNAVLNTPDFIGSLWLDYTFQSGPLAGLGLGSGVRYVGGYFGENANAYQVPAYALFDCAVRYDLGRKIEALRGASISLRVNNIADEEYISKASALVAASYGPGREFSLNLTYTW